MFNRNPITSLSELTPHNEWYEQDMSEGLIQALYEQHEWLYSDILPLAHQEGLKGQKLGFESGPHCNISNAYHEISHLLEFLNTKPERVSFIEFGFEYSQLEVMGQMYNEPTTIQGIDRELRTFAIEFHLINDHPTLSIDLDYFIDKTAPLCSYLGDFINILSQGYLDADVVGYDDKPRITWCADRLRTFVDNYSIEQLKRQWPEVIQRLKHSSDEIRELEQAGMW